MAKKVRPRAAVNPEPKATPKAPAAPKVAAKKRSARSIARAPAEFVFWCHDGSVFADLGELAAGLAAMSEETFAYHSNSEKQDFANWVKDVILEEELAEDLARAIDRAQAVECVTAHLAFMD